MRGLGASEFLAHTQSMRATHAHNAIRGAQTLTCACTRCANFTRWPRATRQARTACLRNAQSRHAARATTVHEAGATRPEPPRYCSRGARRPTRPFSGTLSPLRTRDALAPFARAICPSSTIADAQDTHAQSKQRAGCPNNLLQGTGGCRWPCRTGGYAVARSRHCATSGAHHVAESHQLCAEGCRKTTRRPSSRNIAAKSRPGW